MNISLRCALPSARRAPNSARRSQGAHQWYRACARMQLTHAEGESAHPNPTLTSCCPPRPRVAAGAPFGNGSENPPESARIDVYWVRGSLGPKATDCREKAALTAESSSSCHAEGRGFESLQPLRRTSCIYAVSVPSSSLHAPGWEAFFLAGCQLVAKTPRPESSAKASSNVHPMSFSSVSRPPSPMSMTCW